MLVKKSVPYLSFDGENAHLKEKHKHYGQVQLGMHVLSVDRCDFVLYGKGGIAIKRVDRDDTFIRELLMTLHKVYFGVLLPYLCNRAAK